VLVFRARHLRFSLALRVLDPARGHGPRRARGTGPSTGERRFAAPAHGRRRKKNAQLVAEVMRTLGARPVLTNVNDHCEI
jgi:hypothetical protein